VPAGISVTPAFDTICQGESSTMTASGAQTYSWSPNSMINTSSGPLVIANPIKTKVYNVIGTDIYGCTSTAASTIVVLKNPQLELGPNILVCARTPVQLDAGSTAVSYSWSTGQTTRFINPTITGTYTVTITNANGCTATDNVYVRFKKCYDFIAIPLRENSQPHKNEIFQTESNNDFGADNYNVINLYPNPSSGIVNIEFSDLNESYHLVVRNTIGQKILELNNLQEKSTVSLEAYENGVYIFEIISKENSSSFIVLKQ
jgi:hypothetical protein